MGSANKKMPYNVMISLIGHTHIQYDPCIFLKSPPPWITWIDISCFIKSNPSAYPHTSHDYLNDMPKVDVEVMTIMIVQWNLFFIKY